MNKVLIATILACGLLLLESPEAAAHENKGHQYRHADRDQFIDYRRDRARDRDSRSRAYYARNTDRGERYDTRHKRAKNMPNWLKRDRSFRHWLEHTRLEKNRHISWHQLFDIYRWERSYRGYRRH
jgi:hypothetical protein